METTSRILPGTRVPAMDVPRVGGNTFDVRERRPKSFTVLLAYRGYHCPICRAQLKEASGMLTEFSDRGAELAAVSMDARDRATRSVEEWQLGDLPVAYDLSEATAREWGLYISRSIKEGEPFLFSEPGLFLIRPDATLYAASVQSMPFARPALGDVAKAIDFVLEKDYPPRGDVSEQKGSRAA